MWVVDFFDIYFVIDFEYFVVVGEYVIGDWVGECVLGVGVDVYFYYVVV